VSGRAVDVHGVQLGDGTPKTSSRVSPAPSDHGTLQVATTPVNAKPHKNVLVQWGRVKTGTSRASFDRLKRSPVRADRLGSERERAGNFERSGNQRLREFWPNNLGVREGTWVSLSDPKPSLSKMERFGNSTKVHENPCRTGGKRKNAERRPSRRSLSTGVYRKLEPRCVSSPRATLIETMRACRARVFSEVIS
jgi:hypothetical protein